MLKPLVELKKELARTAVISEEFKTWIYSNALWIAQEAHKHGKTEGLADLKSMMKRKKRKTTK